MNDRADMVEAIHEVSLKLSLILEKLDEVIEALEEISDNTDE